MRKQTSRHSEKTQRTRHIVFYVINTNILIMQEQRVANHKVL